MTPARPFLASVASALALVTTLSTVACGNDSTQSSNGQSVYIPPSMKPQTTQADATPPAVPYSTATPRTELPGTASWPHDTGAYTQGLMLVGDRLLESTGREARSDLREVDRRTGRVLRRTALPRNVFGEGIAVVGPRIYGLTWLTQVGYTYDAVTLAQVDSFHYAGEGWGLATDGKVLFMSDGSSRLRVVDPNGFKVIQTVQVSEADRPVWMLNELEYVRGEIWANIYGTDFIARIDPRSGHVLGWLDESKLLSASERADVKNRGGVANGIAFDSTRDVLLLTGKLWPRLFEVPLAVALGGPAASVRSRH